jgi:hypothetical protein
MEPGRPLRLVEFDRQELGRPRRLAELLVWDLVGGPILRSLLGFLWTPRSRVPDNGRDQSLQFLL